MITAAQFARHVARTVDRVSIAARLAITPRHLEPLAPSFSVRMDAAAMIVGFIPADEATWDEIGLVMRYAPDGTSRATAEQLAQAGLVTMTERGISYTDEARRCAQAIIDRVPAALTKLWTHSTPDLERCAALVAPVAASAVASRRPSPVLFSRPLSQTTTSPAYQVARDITIIRRFRSDCHAQAWTEAGS